MGIDSIADIIATQKSVKHSSQSDLIATERSPAPRVSAGVATERHPQNQGGSLVQLPESQGSSEDVAAASQLPAKEVTPEQPIQGESLQAAIGGFYRSISRLESGIMADETMTKDEYVRIRQQVLAAAKKDHDIFIQLNRLIIRLKKIELQKDNHGNPPAVILMITASDGRLVQVTVTETSLDISEAQSTNSESQAAAEKQSARIGAFFRLLQVVSIASESNGNEVIQENNPDGTVKTPRTDVMSSLGEFFDPSQSQAPEIIPGLWDQIKAARKIELYKNYQKNFPAVILSLVTNDNKIVRVVVTEKSVCRSSEAAENEKLDLLDCAVAQLPDGGELVMIRAELNTNSGASEVTHVLRTDPKMLTQLISYDVGAHDKTLEIQHLTARNVIGKTRHQGLGYDYELEDVEYDYLGTVLELSKTESLPQQPSEMANVSERLNYRLAEAAYKSYLLCLPGKKTGWITDRHVVSVISNAKKINNVLPGQDDDPASLVFTTNIRTYKLRYSPAQTNEAIGAWAFAESQADRVDQITIETNINEFIYRSLARSDFIRNYFGAKLQIPSDLRSDVIVNEIADFLPKVKLNDDPVFFVLLQQQLALIAQQVRVKLRQLWDIYNKHNDSTSKKEINSNLNLVEKIINNAKVLALPEEIKAKKWGETGHGLTAENVVRPVDLSPPDILGKVNRVFVKDPNRYKPSMGGPIEVFETEHVKKIRQDLEIATNLTLKKDLQQQLYKALLPYYESKAHREKLLYDHARLALGDLHVTPTMYVVGTNMSGSEPGAGEPTLHTYQMPVERVCLLPLNFEFKKNDETEMTRFYEFNRTLLDPHPGIFSTERDSPLYKSVFDNAKQHEVALKEFYVAYVEAMLMGYVPDIQLNGATNEVNNSILFGQNAGYTKDAKGQEHVQILDFGTLRVNLFDVKAKMQLRQAIDQHKQEGQLAIEIIKSNSGPKLRLAEWYKTKLKEVWWDMANRLATELKETNAGVNNQQEVILENPFSGVKQVNYDILEHKYQLAVPMTGATDHFPMNKFTERDLVQYIELCCCGGYRLSNLRDRDAKYFAELETVRKWSGSEQYGTVVTV